MMDDGTIEMEPGAAFSGASKREEGAGLLRQGRFAEAVAALTEATYSDPTDEMSWRLLGGASASQGDFSGSVTAFQRAIALAPDNARNYYNLGLSLEALERANDARAAFEQASRIDPAYAAARTKLAALDAKAALNTEFGAPAVRLPEQPSLPVVDAQPRLAPLGYQPEALRPSPSDTPPTTLSASGFAPEPSISAFDPTAGRYLPPPVLGGYDSAAINNSGMRETPPPEVRGGWNWGAFYLNWIWLMNHKRGWWGAAWLVSGFIPYIFGNPQHSTAASAVNIIVSLARIGLSVFLGIKGNEIGWKYRRFQSVEDYKACQKIWAKWSLGLFLVGVVLGILAVTMIIGAGMLAFMGAKGASKSL